MSSLEKKRAKTLIRKQMRMRSRKLKMMKLQEEYEKIKELNERIIEAKMRQVRLNRLFREIEELKELSAAKARQRQYPPRAPKTENDIRIENLKRARELGKEFSRLNALSKYADFIEDFRAEELLAKSKQKLYFLEKRLAYGNKVSRTNAETKTETKPKKLWNARKPETSRLQNRLSYGNTHSYINVLLGLKQKNRNILAELLKEEASHSETDIVTSADNSTDITESKSQEQVKKEKKPTYEELMHEIRELELEKVLQKKSNRQESHQISALEDSLKNVFRSREMEFVATTKRPSKKASRKLHTKPRKVQNHYQGMVAPAASEANEEFRDGRLTSAVEMSASSDLESLMNAAANIKQTGKNLHLLVPIQNMQNRPLKHENEGNSKPVKDLAAELEEFKKLFAIHDSDEDMNNAAKEELPQSHQTQVCQEETSTDEDLEKTYVF